ncbi:MAG TPA: HAD family hydrolase [Chloroflexota bacterium]|nr:HAD family hydrolase [Chloroflexota bacterium]
MSTEAIFFDLDDTLIYEVATDYAVIEEVGRQYLPCGAFSPGRLAEAVHAAARKLWPQSGEIEYCQRIGISSLESLYGEYAGADPRLQVIRRFVEKTDYRERVWTEALTPFGIGDQTLIRTLVFAFAATRRERHVPFPDARRTLERLRTVYRLALLTNGAPAIQRLKLAGSSFADFFELVIVSGELGVGKPDPHVFHYALERMGLTADQVVMIGNSLSADVVGAQEVGIRAIWLNRDGEECPPEIVPDQIVASLDEVLTEL